MRRGVTQNQRDEETKVTIGPLERFAQLPRTESGHRLALFLGTLQRLPNPLERVSLGNSAGIACINGGSQRGQLRLKLLLLPLQGAQGCTDYLAGVFVLATLNLLQYEAF